MQSMRSLEELIAEHPFLSGLDPGFVNLMEPCASLRRFGSRQLIFEEGGEADHFYLILSGKVIVETFVADHGTIPIQTLSAGEALGWSWMFPPYRWAFTAATAAPTETISFAAAPLRKQADQNVEFANELLTRIAKTLIQRLQVTRRGLIQVYTCKAGSLEIAMPDATAGAMSISQK